MESICFLLKVWALLGVGSTRLSFLPKVLDLLAGVDFLGVEGLGSLSRLAVVREGWLALKELEAPMMAAAAKVKVSVEEGDEERMEYQLILLPSSDLLYWGLAYWGQFTFLGAVYATGN